MMDVLLIKPYSRPQGSTDGKDFLEFFINDKPLSELLNTFYQSKRSILDNWIGVLGSSPNLQSEIIKLKQFLAKNITDKELRAAFPASFKESELGWYMDKYREELANPEVIIYCCVVCGDYDCGGLAVRIGREEDTVTWTIQEKDKSLVFKFNKYAYFDVLGARWRYLEKKIRDKSDES